MEQQPVSIPSMETKKRISELTRLVFQNLTPGKEGEPCYGQPDYFFKQEGESEQQKKIRTGVAIALCRVCPIRDSCRQKALNNKEEHGIWGGLTEAHLYKLSKRR